MRCPNFSFDENVALVQAIMDNHSALFGQEKGRGVARRRKEAWSAVEEAVNSVAPQRRTAEGLKKRWNDCKRRVKEKMGQKAMHQRKTGGGPPLEAEYNVWQEMIRSSLSITAVRGLPGACDSGVATTAPHAEPPVTRHAATSTTSHSHAATSTTSLQAATWTLCFQASAGLCWLNTSHTSRTLPPAFHLWPALQQNHLKLPKPGEPGNPLQSPLPPHPRCQQI
ncbi:t-SNARE domain-containing protein 1-like [Bombina bombina]|uniref:t-SNARE domain-containing protein 1-like n=1 Tax=Bombina bombina TaxID=8345 RepID=UPI00235A7D11|nr:t-SNARE domain-containing protein 1-like [Bombina bombina]